jgi:hypothetical protein
MFVARVRSSVLLARSLHRSHIYRPSIRLLASDNTSMPVPQSAHAKLFEGHPTREGWERTLLLWYASSLVLILAVLQYTPTTEIETWANQEARLRLEAGLAGDIKFGEHATDYLARAAEAEKKKASEDIAMALAVEHEPAFLESQETTAARPNIWRRISNVFSALPDVDDIEKDDEDDDNW